jgi:hypothetical protein
MSLYQLTVQIEMEIPTDRDAERIGKHVWEDMEEDIVAALDSEAVVDWRSEMTVARLLKVRREG